MRIGDWSSDVCASDLGNLFPELTEREREVLDLVARGQDNPTIARTLVLTNKTVRNYVYGVSTKPGAADRSALIVTAREARDRKSVVEGTTGSEREDHGGRRYLNQKKYKQQKPT